MDWPMEPVGERRETRTGRAHFGWLLARHDDRLLRDIGLTRAKAEALVDNPAPAKRARKTFLRPMSPAAKACP